MLRQPVPLRLAATWRRVNPLTSQRNQAINFVVAGLVLRDSVLGVHLSFKPMLAPLAASSRRRECTRPERLPQWKALKEGRKARF
jgi:hypothetical protein